jgi:hypothetical protein
MGMNIDDPPLTIDAREWLTANANYPLTVDEVVEDEGGVEVVSSEVVGVEDDGQ